jgi:hypothetical protein
MDMYKFTHASVSGSSGFGVLCDTTRYSTSTSNTLHVTCPDCRAIMNGGHHETIAILRELVEAVNRVGFRV